MMESNLIDRQAAINAVEYITSSMSVCVNSDECHGMKRMQRQAVIELTNLPSAQPDLDSAYTEGYTAAESKYRKMWDEMQAAQPVQEDKWDLFEMISSAWYGKQCYFKQNDGSVYSRLSCRYMTFDDAVREFMGGIKRWLSACATYLYHRC